MCENYITNYKIFQEHPLNSRFPRAILNGSPAVVDILCCLLLFTSHLTCHQLWSTVVKVELQCIFYLPFIHIMVYTDKQFVTKLCSK